MSQLAIIFARVLQAIPTLIGIVIASVVTSLSWFFIEKPFLNLKDPRHENVKTSH